MRARNIEQNAITYTLMIKACAKGRNWQKTIELLAEMARCGIQQTRSASSSSFAACLNAGLTKDHAHALIMDALGQPSAGTPCEDEHQEKDERELLLEEAQTSAA